MTNVYNDTIITIIKVTAKLKENSSITDTWYFGTKYYEAGAIYSGSPEISPILVESPLAQRSLGRFHANQNTISMKLFAHMPFNATGTLVADQYLTFNNIREKYELHGATVQIRTYLKPSNALTTHSDSLNIRQTLELLDCDLNAETNIITLSCYESWFKNNTIDNTLNEWEFPGLIDRNKGKVGGIPFSDADAGEEAIVDLIPIEETSTSGSVYQTTATYFVGWQDKDNAPIGSLESVYAKNRNTEFDPSGWVRTGLPSTNETLFTTDTASWYSTPTGTYDLQDYDKASVDAPRSVAGTRGCYITHAALAVKWQAGGARDDTIGSLKVNCYSAQLIVASGIGFTYQPRGNLIASAEFSLTDSLWANGTSSTTILVAPFSSFIAIGDDAFADDYSNLIFEIEWSNRTGSYYPLLAYDSETDYTHYEKNYSKGDEPGWNAISNVRIGLEALLAHDAPNGFDNSSITGYATYDLETINSYASTNSDKESVPFSNTELKGGVYGLKDTNGYYGEASGAYITNPAVIMKFLMCNAEVGLGIDKDNVDNDAAEDLAGVDYNMTFSIDQDQAIKEILTDIGKQGIMSISTKRNGDILITRPYWSSVPDYRFDQNEMEGDLEIVNIDTLPHSSVINSIEVQFNENELDFPDDIDERYLGKVVLNSEESSDNDYIRMAQAAESEALYERRSFKADFNCYTSRAKATLAANYYFDKFHKIQRELTIAIPKSEANMAIDLYNIIAVYHTDIPDKDGTSDRNYVMEDYYQAKVYEDGILCSEKATGKFLGICTGLKEEESRLLITIESFAPFRYARSGRP